VNDESEFVQAPPLLNGFYLRIRKRPSGTSRPTARPFFDNTYRPELFWAATDIRFSANFPDLFRFDFQTGVQHESNGRVALTREPSTAFTCSRRSR